MEYGRRTSTVRYGHKTFLYDCTGLMGIENFAKIPRSETPQTTADDRIVRVIRGDKNVANTKIDLHQRTVEFEFASGADGFHRLGHFPA